MSYLGTWEHITFGNTGGLERNLFFTAIWCLSAKTLCACDWPWQDLKIWPRRIRAGFPWVKSDRYHFGFYCPQAEREHNISGTHRHRGWSSQLQLSLTCKNGIIYFYVSMLPPTQQLQNSPQGATLNFAFAAPSSIYLQQQDMEEDELLGFSLQCFVKFSKGLSLRMALIIPGIVLKSFSVTNSFDGPQCG